MAPAEKEKCATRCSLISPFIPAEAATKSLHHGIAMLTSPRLSKPRPASSVLASPLMDTSRPERSITHEVFISYSSLDKHVATAGCNILEHAGIRCWVAPRDIHPGLDYAEAIVDGIDGARMLLLVLSANSNKSHFVKLEVERAVSKGLMIMPVRIEDVLPSRAIELFVSSRHWLDAMPPPIEEHFTKLAETIRTVLHLPEPPVERSAIGDPPVTGLAPAPTPKGEPLLVFEYTPAGWVLRNLGIAPALDVLVAQKRVGGGWFKPVRIPPLEQGRDFQLTWCLHANDTGLGASYTTSDGTVRSVHCGNDRSITHERSLLPAWAEDEIVAHWKVTDYIPGKYEHERAAPEAPQAARKPPQGGEPPPVRTPVPRWFAWAVASVALLGIAGWYSTSLRGIDHSTTRGEKKVEPILIDLGIPDETVPPPQPDTVVPPPPAPAPLRILAAAGQPLINNTVLARRVRGDSGNAIEFSLRLEDPSPAASALRSPLVVKHHLKSLPVTIPRVPRASGLVIGPDVGYRAEDNPALTAQGYTVTGEWSIRMEDTTIKGDHLDVRPRILGGSGGRIGTGDHDIFLEVLSGKRLIHAGAIKFNVWELEPKDETVGFYGVDEPDHEARVRKEPLTGRLQPATADEGNGLLVDLRIKNNGPSTAASINGTVYFNANVSGTPAPRSEWRATLVPGGKYPPVISTDLVATSGFHYFCNWNMLPPHATIAPGDFGDYLAHGVNLGTGGSAEPGLHEIAMEIRDGTRPMYRGYLKIKLP